MIGVSSLFNTHISEGFEDAYQIALARSLLGDIDSRGRMIHLQSQLHSRGEIARRLDCRYATT
jgi:hypothetical protein